MFIQTLSHRCVTKDFLLAVAANHTSDRFLSTEYVKSVDTMGKIWHLDG